MAYEAKQYAQRNRQGSDWFSHDGGSKNVKPVDAEPVATEPVPETIEAQANEDNGGTSEVPAAPAPAPPAPVPSAAVPARAQMIKPKCDSNDWYKYEHGGSDEQGQSVTDGAETKRQKEGAVYCRRDKTGSAADWFSHEHSDADQKQSRPLSSGATNAARMRNASDSWFSYDKPAAEESGVVHRKRAAPVKPGTNEMHGVFHHAAADN